MRRVAPILLGTSIVFRYSPRRILFSHSGNQMGSLDLSENMRNIVLKLRSYNTETAKTIALSVARCLACGKSANESEKKPRIRDPLLATMHRPQF